MGLRHVRVDFDGNSRGLRDFGRCRPKKKFPLDLLHLALLQTQPAQAGRGRKGKKGKLNKSKIKQIGYNFTRQRLSF